MQNYQNPYLSPEKFGKENSWEYYFEQPLRIGLEQAYNGENVILSKGNSDIPRPDWSMDFFGNKNNTLTEWRTIVKLGLLKIKPALHEEILATRAKLFAPTDRVCGKHRRRKVQRVEVQQNFSGDGRQVNRAGVQKHFWRTVRNIRPRICRLQSEESSMCSANRQTKRQLYSGQRLSDADGFVVNVQLVRRGAVQRFRRRDDDDGQIRAHVFFQSRTLRRHFT